MRDLFVRLLLEFFMPFEQQDLLQGVYKIFNATRSSRNVLEPQREPLTVNIAAERKLDEEGSRVNECGVS